MKINEECRHFIELGREDILIYNIDIIFMLGIEERRKALEYITEKFSLKLKGIERQGYKVYLLIKKRVMNPNSKVERYKKIWKDIEYKEILDRFICSDEVEVELDNKVYYTAIVQLDMSDINEALELVFTTHNEFIMIISKSEKYLLEDEIKKLFNIAFANRNERFFHINYDRLCKELCFNSDDIFVRMVDCIDEMDCGLVYKQNVKLNKDI